MDANDIAMDRPRLRLIQVSTFPSPPFPSFPSFAFSDMHDVPFLSFLFFLPSHPIPSLFSSSFLSFPRAGVDQGEPACEGARALFKFALYEELRGRPQAGECVSEATAEREGQHADTKQRRHGTTRACARTHTGMRTGTGTGGGREGGEEACGGDVRRRARRGARHTDQPLCEAVSKRAVSVRWGGRGRGASLAGHKRGGPRAALCKLLHARPQAPRAFWMLLTGGASHSVFARGSESLFLSQHASSF